MECYAEYSQTDVFDCSICNKKILIGNVRIISKQENNKESVNIK